MYSTQFVDPKAAEQGIATACGVTQVVFVPKLR